jgi:hypothetical protein
VATVLVELGAGPVAAPVPVVLAQDPKPPPGKGDEFGKASPVGLVVILLLGLVTILLVRSMTKRIKRLPASFEAAPDKAAGDPNGAPSDAPPQP